MRKKRPLKTAEKYLKDPLNRFRMLTGARFVSLFLIGVIAVSFVLYLLIEVNLIFFEAHGFRGIEQVKEAYFDFILEDIVAKWYVLILFSGVLFLLGLYLANLLLRPFRKLAEYCHLKLEGKEAYYLPDDFSDLRFLTRFAQYFFQEADFAQEEKHWRQFNLPTRYLGVHAPVFEKLYFFHFSLILLIICVISLLGLNFLSLEVYEKILKISIQSIEQKPYVTYFLNQQAGLFEMALRMASMVLIILYILLSIRLYERVGGASFGVFSTMRSFLKGNRAARVHLLGFNHLREYTRVINKYLEYLSRI